jgi:hypothetical protein
MGDKERNQKVYKWAASKRKHRVGRGECWDLADQALKHAGAQSSTTTGRDDDYVWGAPVAVGAVIPGDILQFRDYVVTTTTTTKITFGTGQTETKEEWFKQVRSHHTAIVAENLGAKGLVILEQNREPGLPVERNPLPIRSGVAATKTEHRQVKGKLATVVQTTSNEITGWVKAYRPQAKQ